MAPRLSKEEIEFIHNNSHLTLKELVRATGRGKTTICAYLAPTRKLDATVRARGAKAAHENGARVARMEADVLFDTHRSDPNFIIGLALYWAEGTKKSWSFENTDPVMLKVFMRWAADYIPHAGASYWISIPPNADPDRCLAHWDAVVGPALNCYGVTVAKNTRFPQGVCNISLVGTPRHKRVYIGRLIERLGNHLTENHAL